MLYTKVTPNLRPQFALLSLLNTLEKYRQYILGPMFGSLAVVARPLGVPGRHPLSQGGAAATCRRMGGHQARGS